MDFKDCTTLVYLRQINMNLTVKASCTQKCLVKNISTVGSGKDDDTTIGTKTVHLGKQLVEGILALIVATCYVIATTSTTYGIYLVDEDNARTLLLGLTKKVANTTGTDTNEHFHKIRTAHREERHISLTCHSLGKEGLTCTWRPYEQSTLGYLATQLGVFGRIL